MADFYCDVSKISAAEYSTPVAGGTVPTKPEDGNGKSAGTASMATLVITFTGIPAAGGTVTIAGVSFTAVASGASGNQFNAVTSATQCAANLAAAINASTTSIINPTPAITAPLRNVVNATASGAIVTVYTRICGSEWNSVTENSTLTNATITQQWSGGADGAWVYFANVDAAVAWPTSVAIAAYGALPGTYLGAPTHGDVIHVRTARSGSNLSVVSTTAGYTLTGRAGGTRSSPQTFLFDNGVKWPGDAGQFILALRTSAKNNKIHNLSSDTNGCKRIVGARVGPESRNFRIEVRDPQAVGVWSISFRPANSVSDASSLHIINTEVTGENGAPMLNQNLAWSQFSIDPNGGSALLGSELNPRVLLDGVIVKTQATVSPISQGNGTYPGQIVVRDSIIDFTGVTNIVTAAAINLNTNAFGSFAMYGGEIRGLPAASNLSGFQVIHANKQYSFVMRDVKAPNLKFSGGLANGGLVGGTQPSSGVTDTDRLQNITVSSSIGNRNFVYENRRLGFAWLDSAAPKVTSSVLPDGTAFSVRAMSTAIAGVIGAGSPNIYPPVEQHNSLADGTRDVVVRMLVDANINTTLGHAPTNEDIWIDVQYVNTSGTLVFVNSRCAIDASPASLTAGNGADWSATAYDVNGISHTYNPYDITVSCPDMKTGTEVKVSLCSAYTPSSVDDLVFLDPGFTIS